MTHLVDPISDADLDAYVDDQLDAARRIDVEAYLSSNPQTAARVMLDLRTRDELRLALAAAERTGRPSTSDAARRLERGLRQGRLLAGLRRASAIAAMVAAGWFAHSQFGPLLVGPVVASAQPPSYVDDALMAHTTTLLRGSMPSQPEAPSYRPDEIRSATAIVLPELPRDWQLLDVQVFPSKFGPSVELAARSPELGVLSLFAVRPGDFAVMPTRHVIEGDVSAAYWQTGEIAYALVARTDAHDLERTATSLARTLY